MVRQRGVQSPMQLTFVGAGVVRFEYRYEIGAAGVATRRVRPHVRVEHVDARLERRAIGLAAHARARLRHRLAGIRRERADGARERNARARRAGVGGVERRAAAVREIARGHVAAVAGQLLPRHDLNPVLVARRRAPAVDVEDAQRERHVRRHLHAHGAVGLDRRIADHLAHALLDVRAERRVRRDRPCPRRESQRPSRCAETARAGSPAA